MTRSTTTLLRIALCACALVVAALPSHAQKLFTRILPEQSNVNFRHVFEKINISKDSLTRINSMVPGCGVGIGDITGDGKPDIVVSSFSGTGFYRNEGNFVFTDITSKIGYPEDSLQFTTGVNLVDIDADGDLDVFLARWQNTCRFLINNGDGTFVERASAYGLDLKDETVHSVFFDYDRDGLLDCYLVTYSNHYAMSRVNLRRDSVIGAEAERKQRERLSIPTFKAETGNERNDKMQNLRDISATEMRHNGVADKLYRNLGNGTFRDVSYSSWIDDDGMGLSATVADINLDGWPDIYVANDFNSTDLVYLNNGDGTFAESMMRMTRRASVFSMGSDIADINGDGLPDIVTTDMLPENHFRRILNASNSGDMSIFNPTYDSNQVSRNMVQLNRGYNQFSDIGYMTNMAATDWSWTCLIQDFDLDGVPEVFIGNGYTADISNQDYVYNINNQQRLNPPSIDYLREPNYMFKQRTPLDYYNVGYDWGVSDTSTTFGAAWGDLDGDGDLELIVPNMDSVVFIYKNNALEQKRGGVISFNFLGAGGNRGGLGAKVRVVAGGKAIYREHWLVRGYQSCMDTKMSVGVGTATIIDSVIVQWPDGPSQILTNLPVNSTHTLAYADASPTTSPLFRGPEPEKAIFTDATTTSGITFWHEENYFDDFKRYRLMPTRISWGGPAVAVGDVNNDGLDDVIFGARKGKNPVTYVQKTPGTFAVANVGLDGVDTTYESQAMLLIDIDGDKDRDLVIAGGGPEFSEDAPERGLRIYLNDGKGKLTRMLQGVPAISTNATTLNACDYDNDGDIDLFIGGGVETDKYPMPATSYLLDNNGKGMFTDVTMQRMPTVRNMGIIRTALWSDADNDGRFDLLLAGEWMPLTVMHNDGATFTDWTVKAGLKETTGWWYSVMGADIDNDGDMDYIAGNIGLNTRYRPTPEHPIEMFAADFDDNGSVDPLITWWYNGRRHIIRDRGKVFSQMPTLNRRFNDFIDFTISPVETIIGDTALMNSAYYKAARMMESVVLINNGNGTFAIRTLPAEAQISPVLGIEAMDLNNDALVDLVLTGNMYGAEDDVVRYDAGKGLVLMNQAGTAFAPLTIPESGFVVQFDARGLVSVRNPKSVQTPVVLIAGVNQRNAMTYLPTQPTMKIYPVDPSKVTSGLFSVGTRQRKVEVYCGSAYRGQSSCHFFVPPGSSAVTTFYGTRKVGTAPIKAK